VVHIGMSAFGRVCKKEGISVWLDACGSIRMETSSGFFCDYDM
jgi:hypothetical protein